MCLRGWRILAHQRELGWRAREPAAMVAKRYAVRVVPRTPVENEYGVHMRGRVRRTTTLCLCLLVGYVTALSGCAPAPAPVRFAASHPNLYLDRSEIDELKARLDAHEEPWAAAYGALLARANVALSLRPGSVTDNGGGRVWNTEQPYTSDGIFSPNANRQDYMVGRDVSAAIRDLGLAYQLAGDAKYADKAIELIKVWFLNPSTSLRAGTGAANEIEVWITMPAAFYGIDLLWNYPAFRDRDKHALQRWAEISANRLRKLRRENNWENWRLVYLLTLAHIAGDKEAMEEAIDRWRNLAEHQIDENGLLRTELDRTLSLDYSIFALNPMAQGAEIARHFGVDLYGYRNSRGQSLASVFDAYVPFVLDPSSWPHPQIRPFDATNNGIAVYELAYSRYERNDTYRSVVEKYQRPMIETRTLGNVTLTHGSTLHRE